jgi:LysM repeat protein
MNKFFKLFIFSLFITNTLFASVVADSVGTKNVNGKDYVIYMVNAGETVYGISSKYKVPINDLLELNPELENGLKTGQLITLPITEAFLKRNAKTETATNVKPITDAPGFEVHTVKPGETLYSIAKEYGVSVDELMKWNNLEPKVGQTILVKTKTDKPIVKLSETKEKEIQETKVAEANNESKPNYDGENYSNPALKDKKRVLIVPFDPYLYFSDADDEIAKASKMNRTQIRQVFRKRLNALLEPRGYETIRMIGGGHSKDTIDELNKVYASVTYNYQKTVSPKNIMPENYKEQKNEKGVTNWVNSKLNTNNQMQGSTQKGQGLHEMYFGVKVKDEGFYNYFNGRYLIDYYVFVSQFEVKTNYDNCIDRSRGDYERDFIVHYSIFNKEGKQIAGNRVKVFYNSNSNNVYKIANDNLQKVADAILADIPHPNEDK